MQVDFLLSLCASAPLRESFARSHPVTHLRQSETHSVQKPRKVGHIWDTIWDRIEHPQINILREKRMFYIPNLSLVPLREKVSDKSDRIGPKQNTNYRISNLKFRNGLAI